MQFKTMRTYVGVMYQGKVDNYFASNKADMIGAKIELVGTWGVRLSTAKDCIIVPLSNIAFLSELEPVKGTDARSLNKEQKTPPERN